MGKKILDSKLLYALLAIAIAVGLWFYVAAVENPDGKTDMTLPITFLNEDVLEEKGMMISAGHDQTVTLTLEGPWTMLAKLDQEKSRISLSVDVSKITSPGVQSMAYNISLPSGYASGVSVTNRDPGNVEFTVSRSIRKEIEVHGRFTGTLAEGYMQGEFSILPGTIRVSGVESEVNRIAYALVTVGGKELDTSFTGDLDFALVDAQGEELTDLSVTCSAQTVSVTMPVLKTADVPLSAKLIAGGGVTDINKYVTHKIEPASITVSGTEDDLASIKEIILGEIRLADIIGRDTVEFEIPLNSDLENLSGITTATVTVTISGLETKVLEVDNIECIHVPNGFQAVPVTQSLQVLVRGPEEALDLVLAHNLRVVADLSEVNAAAGRYTVSVKVYVDGTRDVGVVGDDYKIVVDLSR